jgi:aminopeptidase N/puromycin-sensitive aminopeptidase
MEATDARRAFPSFDEPAMKATFAITAIVDKGDVALSNSSVIADTPGPGDAKRTVRFATTPRMSSYLVALTIGDFACIEDAADGVALRICGTPEKLAVGGFAMDASKFILEYLNDYYGIPYPSNKLDQIGVADFRAGAMENFGSIIYRDSRLFLDPASASTADQISVSGVMAQ